MNLLQAAGPSFTNSEETSLDLALGSSAFMREDGSTTDEGRPAGLTAHDDARALVRLIQCPQCSRPFRTPVTLPCGHSLCRQCLSDPFRRENISYPATPDRHFGIQCPLEDCLKEHPVGECNLDVTLLKVMESISQVVSESRSGQRDTPILVQETEAHASKGQDTPMVEKEEQKAEVLHGGRLVATYTLAEMGLLDIDSQVSYESLADNGHDYHEIDDGVLGKLREMTHKELDCHVCYNMLLDPVTTSCGHTFCRKCLTRALDHTSHCPVCRRTLHVQPSLESQPSNQALVSLLKNLCPALVAARAEAVALEERGSAELDVPLFVCTLGFPAMPTFLHIFEPRYRLMIRRALEGNGHFGMLMYNRNGTPQEHLGLTRFKEYGTMLQILNVQMLPDGRSLIETRGTSRFRVREYAPHDGYTIGSVDRVEDVSLAEEERLEAEEMRIAEQELAASPPENTNDATTPVNRLSTRDLLLIGVSFIEKMRANSAPWLHQRILDAYGGPPDDPALFPYWFASILPIAEEEKYLLLQTTSVRERLKIVVGWIRRIESQRWYSGGACTVL
ncbi:hypothetical protein K490DRAFT_71590 [Saccharata proteae CBS 121410]|uniref:ATP-dependent protease-like protein n=1 Tax=Saccharata proteae CBS 121410 TaxID=1314787 RepID=A0A9P4I0W6_9PEZI|nr:hypothetical protein K490DRAFT_71590 [Saccharata proteae CBS 121410]